VDVAAEQERNDARRTQPMDRSRRRSLSAMGCRITCWRRRN
jgi:hypothetical protein